MITLVLVLRYLIENRSIRCNKEIQGIVEDNEEIKLHIFADDRFIIFLKDGASLNALFGTVQCFALYSGLKINYDKR